MENISIKTRRKGRGVSRKTKSAADAFRLLPEPAMGPKIGFLSEGDIEKLKSHAFNLLSDYGVVVIHPKAVKALTDAGAKPGSGADRLRLPVELVEEALAETPKSVSLYGKVPERAVHLPRSDGGFIMRTGTGAHGYVDPATSEYRNLDIQAIKEIGAVSSGLDQVGFVAHPFVAGVPESIADIHSFATMINHTDKHCWVQPYSKESVEYLMRICVIAAGSEENLRKYPLASCITCSFSPLEFKHMDTEVIIQSGQYGLPVHACSLPSAGGTAPLSMSGLVLMAAAEILSMVTLAHLLAPKTPVIATPLMFSLDMRTGSALQSSPETLQAASMSVQLMKYGFGLLTHTYGAGSDTPDADIQSMAERALLAQTVALSGADILGGIGQLECATVQSPVQAILDNEIGAMLRKFIQPTEISEESLNWNEMSSIRTGGHFLDSPHTLALCRQQHQPDVFLRMGRDDYEAAGRRTAFDAAREKALELIANAPSEGVLSEDQSRELLQIREDADRIILADSTTSEVI